MKRRGTDGQTRTEDKNVYKFRGAEMANYWIPDTYYSESKGLSITTLPDVNRVLFFNYSSGGKRCTFRLYNR